MAGHDIKNAVRDIECPVFETSAFTTPPPLENATVAIVTSASLHHPEQDDFAARDTSCRALDAARRDYMVGHWSPNFDPWTACRAKGELWRLFYQWMILNSGSSIRRS